MWRRHRAEGGDGVAGHESTHVATWRAIHRAHQAEASEMVIGEIMRRTAAVVCRPAASCEGSPNRRQGEALRT